MRANLIYKITISFVFVVVLIVTGELLMIKTGPNKELEQLFEVQKLSQNIEMVGVFSKLYKDTGQWEFLAKVNNSFNETGRLINNLILGISSKGGIETPALKDPGLLELLHRFQSSLDVHRQKLLKLNEVSLDEASLPLRYVINNNDDLALQVQTIAEALEAKASSKSRDTRAWLYVFLAGVVTLLTATLIFIKRKLLAPLAILETYAQNLAKGEVHRSVNEKEFGYLSGLKKKLDEILDNLSAASVFAKEIGEGQFNTNLDQKGEKMELAKSLEEMRNRLMEVAEEEKQRNWAIEGLARFGTILRNQKNVTLNELANEFLENLVKFIGCNQGGVFLTNDEDKSDKYIELIAAYAYGKRKYTYKRIEFEEGFIGQCYLEKGSIYLEEVPDDYIKITSGLGEANPKNIFIAPVLSNEEVLGVVELASFTGLPSYKREFVVNVCENLASTISMMKMNINTQKLLEESIEAINKTNAKVELDVDGVILEVNQMFLSVMGYERESLVGQKEEILIRKEDHEAHNLMWNSLKDGSFHSGEYCRLGSRGNKIWINGTYNPIKNLDGKIYKIIHFGQFTTEEKERDLELRTRINAYGAEFLNADLDLNGKFIKTNQEFVKLFGLKRTEIRNLLFSDLVTERSLVRSRYHQMWKELSNGNTQIETFELKTNQIFGFYKVSFVPIRNLSGQIHKVMIIMVDITRQKSIELELLSNRNRIPAWLAENEIINTLLTDDNEIVNEVEPVIN